ncbi:glycogen debranching protein GlgX [Aeromonas simiae]|uniref:glycogen debranching protein GlgX n=1 Tax=Aeromonas simiae TaxID=218936 RepID=UPI00266BB9D3|nr:glycogen debranching protein GlgX [Aeromonas simiae]MDO2947692.1 glycogen debranching protein GlgX [Aeromonas simiae]MDO2952312.1 glycogen debranching protein GlgX [Aeromonas simiae]MDO2954907.1 glycogen debranching protein GlgX [Aeromonas simiae]
MRLSRGHCFPLGSSLCGDGVNFAIWARLASQVELLLFASAEDDHPEVIPLSPRLNRTAYYWHIHVAGIGAGQRYAFRIHGPWRPYEGTRFDRHKVLLDPYSHSIELPPGYRRQAAAAPGSNLAGCARSRVVDLADYDWEGDQLPAHSLSRSVIYELHLGGFTRSPTSRVSAPRRGGYLGLIEKIPYLQALGVTAVELLPIFQFDPQDAPPGLANYWGYSPLCFFAPHAQYAQGDDPVRECRDMIKALHRAGIEVILDVVYNHTAEGGDDGPILSFRGIDNETYYILDSERRNTNFSGCGNTFNGAHPVALRMIIESLRFWRQEMHVDGFRFDLAAILSRDESGQPVPNSPTLRTIDTDPRICDAKLIAEAWDAGGLYQVGSLAGARWREWNGQFRDDVRRFIRGDEQSVQTFAQRLIGSPDIYHYHHADPEKSINFVTCHDGFTLWDWASYDERHNQANGEQNRDGSPSNFSWNHGEEGPSQDPAINTLRLRQAKNMMVATLLSVGTPMLLMGDERLRSQGGNNNAYCQDNPTSWLDWRESEPGRQMQRFVTELIRYRKHLLGRSEPERMPHSLAELLRHCEICWHGVTPYQPDWGPHSHSIAMSALSHEEQVAFYLVFNSYWAPLDFTLPSPPHGIAGYWRRILDTALPAPEDIAAFGSELEGVTQHYRVEARSCCLLVSGADGFCSAP